MIVALSELAVQPAVQLGPVGSSGVSRRVLLGGLGALALTGCHAVRRRERRLVVKAERAGFRTSTHRLGDATVRVHAGGSGRPVLLLHGFGPSAVWQWSPQLRDFGRRHRVLAPDLLWFGGSSSTATPSMDRQVEAMLALLDARGIDRVAIVGLSYGGLVGWELAVRHPDRVARLLLVDSPGDEWTAEDHAAMLARMSATRAADVFVPSTPDEVRRLIDLAYTNPPRIGDTVARMIVREVYEPHREAQIALLDELEARVKAPPAERSVPRARMHLVWGADDPVFPLAVGKRLAARVQAELLVIPRGRHFPNVEHAERFTAEALAFLAPLARSSSSRLLPWRSCEPALARVSGGS